MSLTHFSPPKKTRTAQTARVNYILIWLHGHYALLTMLRKSVKQPCHHTKQHFFGDIVRPLAGVIANCHRRIACRPGNWHRPRQCPLLKVT